MTPDQALDQAITKGEAAALAQWERDGKKDCGSCGGAMLELYRSSPIGKAAIARKIIDERGDDGFVRLKVPEPIRTQHMEVFVKQTMAFRDELRALGFGGSLRRFWTYVD